MKKVFCTIVLAVSLLTSCQPESPISENPSNTESVYTSYQREETPLVVVEETATDVTAPGYVIIYPPLEPNGNEYHIIIDCMDKGTIDGDTLVRYGYGTGQDGKKFMIKATTYYMPRFGKFFTKYESVAIPPSEYGC